MSPRFVFGRENVPCVAEVVNRSLKADCTDFTKYGRWDISEKSAARLQPAVQQAWLDSWREGKKDLKRTTERCDRDSFASE